ncbi:MAG: PVC-type heme-binding CxxCH protein [Planctomycetota bacterium]|nr:PVC-type heme-binding CxxCH protein [Planctomycetota bacterium]
MSCRATVIAFAAIVGAFSSGSTSAAEDSIKVLFFGDNGHHRPAERFKQLQPVLARRGINLTYTNRLSDFNSQNLSRYAGLAIYANTTKISPEQEKAMLVFVADGGGLIPIHCASYCFLNSPAYVELVGGQFKRHGTGTFSTNIVRADHPIMRGFGGFESWDETYVHDKHNDKNRTVLSYRIDETGREPWTWTRTHGDGRVFYTAWGHDQRTWSNPGFHNLIERGIRWAVGADPAAVPGFYDPNVFNVPEVTAKRKDVKPFEYVKAKVPFYPPGKRWGTTEGDVHDMQLPLSAAESIKHIVTPVDFEVKLFAAEPDIVKPICMSWDERGRLWVGETFDYPNELQPEGQGRDRIKICADTDGDGHADKFTVFAEKLSIPTAITFWRGGVIVQDGTQTLYLKDTNGDDKADERKVLISGWNMRDTHGGVSNFQYGMDNWIWAMQGYNHSQPTVAGKQHPYAFRMGFFRFMPDGSALEFVRSTNNNTWGLGITEEGIILGSTANHNPSTYMPIANRHYETVSNFSSGNLGTIADTYKFRPITDRVRQVDQHGGYTAGAGHAIYTARTYPKQYWNRTAFVCGPTGHLVGTFVLNRAGSDFKSTNPSNLVASDDDWSAPIMAEVGPDGNVWVLDWYNYIVQHNPTPGGYKTGKGNAYETDLRDKRHGRIYRLVYKRAEPQKPMTLAGATPEQLVAALKHPTMHWRKHAQRLLVERGKQDVVAALAELVEDTGVDHVGLNVGAIHALWTLHGLQAETNARQTVFRALSHPSAGVRRNAAQVVPPSHEATTAILAAGLLEDKDAQVRLAAFLALAEMPRSSVAGAAIFDAIRQDSNANDRWIPDAATIAAAKHDAGFLKAVLASTTGSGREVEKPETPKKPVNLLANPSFEEVSGQQPTHWKVRNYNGQSSHKLAAGGRTGKYCVEISSEKGSDTSWFHDVTVKPNTNYQLTGWVKAKELRNVRGAFGALFNVHELQGAKAVRTKGITGTKDWTPLSITFNSHNRSVIGINCLFGGWGQSAGTAWYDDLELIELGPGGPPLESGLHPAVDKVLRLVAENYAGRGDVDSIVGTVSSLKGADEKLTAALLDGLVSGWPADTPPKLTPADLAELATLMKALPQSQRDRLVALADRWNQRNIFGGDVRIVLKQLAEQVGDSKLKPASRIDAAERLVRLEDDAKTTSWILKQMTPQAPPQLVQGLLQAIASSRSAETGRLLASRAAGITPASRRIAISVLLRRKVWTVSLLDALEEGLIDVSDLSDQARQQVTTHRDAELAARARKIAGAGQLPNPDRQKIIDTILPALGRSGDVAKGQALFKKKCAQCHTIDGDGGKVGPPLTGIGKRNKQELLIEILDPNRSVEGNYRQWTVVTADGVQITGLLTAESATSVELLDAEGKKHTIERSDIDELDQSKLSLMPVGLEKDLHPQDFADLLEFLSRSRPK